MGLLPRCSEEWKTRYKLRTVIELYNSSAKHSRLLDTHRYFTIEKIFFHVAMSLLAYLATALAHLKANDYFNMLHMRVKLPKVRKRKPRHNPDPGITATHLLHEYNQTQQAA